MPLKPKRVSCLRRIKMNKRLRVKRRLDLLQRRGAYFMKATKERYALR